MKRLLFFASAVLLLIASSCKTAEECPKAYSYNVTIEQTK